MTGKKDKDVRLERHTAHVADHGTSKKGGAGKGNWGVPGQEGEEPAAMNKKDPNYDSDQEK
eukprot:CAMPEP_0184326610 /NCGR_PEP_ID=MMETSP1049-20130417/142652_1 /TAXON_ID=77928 /ORGANISM="Proteomonas sulcata, Strain CCMP704" /LENGTH=60 /DNA_ID=CAMNT_0026648813 /DNA_START=559 /DNA_END=741 /DNA_ORIENTATION=-